MLAVDTPGQRLKVLRRSRGLTQEELAARAKVSPATVIRFEQDQGEPQVRTLKRIAQALDVDISELVRPG